jgi:RimJ/RimL family protein N-acetyltransferase
MVPVKIRRLSIEDVDELVGIIDNETAQLTRLNCPFTKTDAENFINLYNTYGVKYMYNNSLIGAFEIKPSGETAYVISKKWRNKGVCTQVLRIAKRIAERDLKINHLWCIIHPNNKSSIRVAQKAGLEIKDVKKEI